MSDYKSNTTVKSEHQSQALPHNPGLATHCVNLNFSLHTCKAGINIYFISRYLQVKIAIIVPGDNNDSI